ncbi:MAG TPA: DUF4892 domain-containing protein [Salinisphaeraceae bacterium]|nr:DUF4892 domain-containing protein [Salinisphaeraceae bacterium]
MQKAGPAADAIIRVHWGAHWGRCRRLLVALWLAGAFALLSMLPPAAHAQAAGGLQPALPALADAHIEGQAHAEFDTYPLIIKKISQRGGIKGNISATRTVEGELLHTTYRVADAAAQELLDSIADELRAAGYERLFACDGRDCGPTFTQASPGFRLAPKFFNVAARAQHYLALRKPGPIGDRYVAVQAVQESDDAPVYVQLDVMQTQPRVVGEITVKAAEMAQQLQTKGRVVLSSGLFFATDSTAIKPGSRSTLSEIAKLMAANPQLKLLVVGHTDNTGSFEYNLDLSRRRAQAVVAALVNDYGVDRERLKPWGVSYAAPRTSNAKSIGRSRNRRVELVRW